MAPKGAGTDTVATNPWFAITKRLWAAPRTASATSTSRVRTLALIAVAGCLAVLIADRAFAQQIVLQVFIWALFGISWNIIAGYAGQLSFGHGIFLGIGSYTCALALMYWHLTPIVGALLAIPIAVLASLLIGLATFRLSGIYFGLATLAWSLLLIPILGVLNYQEVTVPYELKHPALYLQFMDPRIMSFIALGLLVIGFGIAIVIERSLFGARLMAIRDDEIAASASGINTYRLKLIAFAISAAIASVAGMLYLLNDGVATPNDMFGLLVSAQVVAIVLLGGAGRMWAPLVGSIIVTSATSWLQVDFGDSVPGIGNFVLGGVLIVVTIVVPGGLGNLAAAIGRRVRRPATAQRPDSELASVMPAERVVAVPKAARRSFVDAPVVLSVSGITRRFGGIAAVSEASFVVHEGEIVGLIGPNGAGKTTLLNLITGFDRPDAGTVEVRGKDVTHNSPWRLARKGLGRTFQVSRSFRGLSVASNLAVPVVASGGTTFESQEYVAQVLPEYDEIRAMPADRLNTGQLRRLELSRVLISRPSVLLLDEPLAGLTAADSATFAELLRAVAEAGVAMIVVEHSIGQLSQLADRIVALDFGAIVADASPSELLKNPKVVAAYLGQRWAERNA